MSSSARRGTVLGSASFGAKLSPFSFSVTRTASASPGILVRDPPRLASVNETKD
jgi:hypothetical protein